MAAPCGCIGCHGELSVSAPKKNVVPHSSVTILGRSSAAAGCPVRERARGGRSGALSVPLEASRGHRTGHGAPRVCSDLDRSTVWAEAAVSSRFLRMALALGIGAADEALTWIGYAKIFRAVTADRCYVSMPTALRSTSSIRPIGRHRSEYLGLAHPC